MSTSLGLVAQNHSCSQLLAILEDQSDEQIVKNVVHWFRGKGLRIHDNLALHHAPKLAQASGTPLICLHCWCPAEDSWHGTRRAQVDSMLEGLKNMQKELLGLNIPLVFLTVERERIMSAKL
jgi:deoxyribodipyrimidine photo-lyase